MKMHRILAEATAEILKAVFRERRVLDGVLAEAFEANPRWGKRDRNFIASSVFEVVRWRRALAFVADCEEITALCAAQWHRMGHEIPEWWHHRGTSVADMVEREAALASQARAVRESIPDWLDEVGEQQLGAAWDQEIAALNRPARVFLRVNRLKATPQQVITWLGSHGVEVAPVEGVSDALVLPVGAMLPKDLRADGRVEIQDAGSQLIAPMLKAQAGQRIIDACSGAGGKALHLASLMGNQGRIYAMDVAAAKLSELERRARRAGVTCIQVRRINDDTARDFAGVADGLLIDSPCSGLGTLRRQPDLKWRLKPADLERVCGIQRDLLQRYLGMLKPGGRLVYATCSILPQENRAAIDHLLAANPRLRLEEDLTVSPAETGFDGFYAAAVVDGE